jgi:type III pantothenate kinase
MSYNLLIDVGNTQSEVGIFKSDKMLKSWRFSSKLFNTEDEIATLIRGFLSFENINFTEISRIAISSVVPDLSFILKRLGEKYFNQIPLFVNSKLKLPIVINYNNPENVGADRICGAVAAYLQYKDTVIVVDLGTATTFDVVNKQGEYLGGAITLGIEGIISTLHQKASKLPKVNIDVPLNYIGKSTEQSIQSGVFLGNIEMIKGVINGIKQELAVKNCTVIATGGLASLLVGKIPEITEYQPDLILNGLYQIMELN